ncbi:MAG TPA: carbamoyl-phosphate synthase large subunit, partial [Thermoplasmata archaeon]|nr:carbamoyl-phosphate synthase large subunit [Thermoplasmata archaeon]
AGYGVGLVSKLTRRPRKELRALFDSHGLDVSYRMVDSCAGEFEAATPYFYSTRGEQCEIEGLLGALPGGAPSPRAKRKVLIVGSGPIRIGQGIEFDCCCVQGVEAIREAGGVGLMVNCNPETVSTDFDVSDRLYFEPLTLEDVFAIIKKEKPDGVILQFGGQTPLNLAVPLEKAIREEGLPTQVLGTPVEGLNIAEDRKLFNQLIQEIGLKQPKGGTAYSAEEAKTLALGIGFPVMVRPSYVIGGRGMEIVYSEEELERYVSAATLISDEHPVLVDDYLEHAIEVDVDACSDGRTTWIGGVLEHVEEAGVHSGDASMVLPPQELSARAVEEIEEETRIIARALRVRGLLNVQFAVKKNEGREEVYVLEANPRASRTVPFISKALGVSMAKLATRLMLGESLDDFHLPSYRDMGFIAVKSSVFPFGKIRGIDTILGPEMKSTGEVMGLARTFGEAFYKAQVGAYNNIDPGERKVYVTVRDEDKEQVGRLCAQLGSAGVKFVATQGTAQFLRSKGVECEVAFRVSERRQPDALGLMRSGDVGLIVNTPSSSSGSKRDGYMMRRLAVELGVPYITTVRGFRAAVEAILTARSAAPQVRALDEYLAMSTERGSSLDLRAARRS